MHKPFVYDEKTSSLFSPNGEFIKQVFCPKAVNWNQLVSDDPKNSLRACNHCNERILNLDTNTLESA